MPGCPAKPSVGGTTQLAGTVRVPAGTTFVGNGTRYTLGGGSQAEGQPPLWILENGATIRDVVIGTGASDGIHCVGSCTIQNVWWEDIGEDAATGLGPAGSVMTVNCGGAFQGDDKTFQHNGRGEVRISNFKANDAGKLYRSCGDCTGNGGPRRVRVENVRTNNVPTIAGINENFGDTFYGRNITVNGGSTKIKVCQTYRGVVKGQGSTSATGVRWSPNANCDVLPSHITLVNSTQLNVTEWSGGATWNVMTE